ncbi:MAG: hypothetical protein HRU38_08565 [Saccharospirillaceae bacterium]|nr:hypothetical protein [Pseudomonadales bacterium]NRB78706.1 hypothetical protein [Saccharospirillaceae bacterium]
MSSNMNVTLKKLVVVDSAGFCYSEIDLDNHTILLGEGNVGKSSLLNCIRLFILPESNFRKAKDKFNFRSSNGDEYSQDDSYNHYFPTKHSHLIIEIEKTIAGTTQSHCQILYRGSNLSYDRIFTTLPYNKLRGFIWQVEANDDKSIGSRVDGFSTKSLISTIKSQDKHMLVIKDSQKLKDLLYTNDILSVPAMRYSLFPLNSAEPEQIESLRALILMLFDMKTSNTSVAKAVANIIETEKKEKSDALNFDLKAFFETHDQLQAENTKVIEIENLSDKHHRIKDSYDKYTKLSGIESRFVAFYLALKKSIAVKSIEHHGISTKIREVLNEKKPLENQIKDLEADIKSFESTINRNNRRIPTLEQSIKTTKFELSLYNDSTPYEAIELMKKDIEEKLEKLSALESADKRITRIEKLSKEISLLDKRLAELTNSSNSPQDAITSLLPASTLSFLNSLNPNLISAQPGRNMLQEDKNKIIGFESLFKDEGNYFNFFNIRIDVNNKIKKYDPTDDISNIEDRRREKRKELKDLESFANSNILYIEKEIKSIKHENEVTTKLINNAENITNLEVELKVLTEQVESAFEDINLLKPQLISAESKNLNLAEEYKFYQVQMTDLDAELDKQIKMKLVLEVIIPTNSKIEHLLKSDGVPIVNYRNDNTVEIEISDEAVRELQVGLQEIKDLRTSIINGLKEFIQMKVIGYEATLFADMPGSATIKKCYTQLDLVYLELPTTKDMLKTRTKSHNESVSNYVDILQKNSDHIIRFESQINQTLKDIHINDLTGIKISIEVDQRFKSLISEIGKSFNPFSTEQNSDLFYERLKVFSEAFFKGDGRNKLQMVDIISKINYSVQKDGQEIWQTKQQSTSTTSLINLKLVRMLLSKLRASHCNVLLPVIMDEAANINVDQYEWLLKDIKDSGFFLFTAGTHSSSSELIYKIGTHYDVDALKTSKSYSKDRTRVVWGGPQAFYDQHEFITDENQIGLLEGVDETI